VDDTWTSRAPTALGPHRRAVAVVAAALLLAACGSSSTGDTDAAPTDPASPTTTTTIPPTTTAPALSPEEEVAAVYRAFWDATITANNPPNPNDPSLAASMTGELLSHLKDRIAQRGLVGEAVRLPHPSTSVVLDLDVTVSGSEAAITACVVDDAIVYDQASGRVLNDRVTSGRTEASAVLTPDGWRVSWNGYLSEVEGPEACAG
jgi:hypothetical protein